MRAFTSTMASLTLAITPPHNEAEADIPEQVKAIAEIEAWGHGGTLNQVIHHEDGSFSMRITLTNGTTQTVALGCCPPRPPQQRPTRRNEAIRRKDDDDETPDLG